MTDFNTYKREKQYKRSRSQKKNFSFRKFLFILIFSVILILGIYFGYNKFTSDTNIPPDQTTDTSQESVAKTVSSKESVETTSIPTQSNQSKMTQLASDIDDISAKYTESGMKNYSVIVDDSTTDNNITLNADNQLVSASLYKLFILYKVECDISAGSIDENTLVTITAQVNYDSEDAGSFGPAGSKVKVGDLKEAMIEDSNNTAGLALGYFEDWDKLQSFLDTNGFTKTDIWPSPKTSANDVYQLLNGILNKNLKCQIKDAQYDDMINLLKNQHIKTNLSPGFPDDAVFAHKTGNLDDIIHDAGILFLPNNRTIVIVAMTQGDLYADEGFLTKLAENTWSDLVT